MKNLKFKAYLVENGIGQEEVAKLLGLTRSCVNLKLNGKKNFSLKEIRILCSEFNISADEYFL